MASKVVSLKQQAERGDSRAAYQLGRIFSQGTEGQRINKTDAAKYYDLAAKGGHTRAAFNLAVLYMKGDGVPRDPGRALSLYRQASTDGDAQAAFNAGLILLDQFEAAEALKMFSVAAERGLGRAALRAGEMLENGATGVPADASKAALMYYQAAKQDDPACCLALGSLYDRGAAGFARDQAKAETWMKVAANSGDPEAIAWMERRNARPTVHEDQPDDEPKKKKKPAEAKSAVSSANGEEKPAGKAVRGKPKKKVAPEDDDDDESPVATKPKEKAAGKKKKKTEEKSEEKQEGENDHEKEKGEEQQEEESDSEMTTDSEDEGAQATEEEGGAGKTKKKVRRDEKIARILKELDDIVGLEKVKEEIHTLVNVLEVNRMRKKMGLDEESVGTMHMVFMGNPGTGKTTVARIVAKLLKSLHVLSKGHLVEVDRAGLVGEYAGQTAPKTEARCKEALGGVLFIDEAYALVNSATDSYGKEAIAKLLTYMEEHRDNLLVIVAGYTDEMSNFFDTNPGLRSRFPRKFVFADYTGDELVEIAHVMMRGLKRTTTPEAEEKLRILLQHHATQPASVRKEGGNGRYVRNILDVMKRNNANRIALVLKAGGKKSITPEMLTTFTDADIPDLDPSAAAATKKAESSAPSSSSASSTSSASGPAAKAKMIRESRMTKRAERDKALAPADPIPSDLEELETHAWSLYREARQTRKDPQSLAAAKSDSESDEDEPVDDEDDEQ